MKTLDISTLDQPERMDLLIQLERSLGLYSLGHLCLEDVKEHCEGMGDETPTDESIRAAICHVWKNYDTQDAINWVIELASEYDQKVQA